MGGGGTRDGLASYSEQTRPTLSYPVGTNKTLFSILNLASELSTSISEDSFNDVKPNSAVNPRNLKTFASSFRPFAHAIFSRARYLVCPSQPEIPLVRTASRRVLPHKNGVP